MKKMHEELREAEEAATGEYRTPKGVLTITAPMGFRTALPATDGQNLVSFGMGVQCGIDKHDIRVRCVAALDRTRTCRTAPIARQKSPLAPGYKP
jgi:hypothetical protein